jgi:hypothetical protein
MAWMGMFGLPGRFRNDLRLAFSRCGRWCGMVGECVPQYTSGNVATTADGDHQVGFEIIQDLLCVVLTEFVDLQTVSCDLHSLVGLKGAVSGQDLDIWRGQPFGQGGEQT